MNEYSESSQSHTNDRPSSATHWVLIGFLAVAVLFLALEHRAHLLGILPFLILLACPLMHFFMHRGHGGGHQHGSDGDRT